MFISWLLAAQRRLMIRYITLQFPGFIFRSGNCFILWLTFFLIIFCLVIQDINSVAVSPNDKLLASGSQDRTAKLWSLTREGNLGLLGVFRGHRRGVWAVCFSPVDQVLATSSADGTTKLWSLQDFSCLKVNNVSPYEISVMTCL